MQVASFRLPGISGLTLIGSGGFSDVYRGHQDHIGRAVAVKVLRVTMVDKSAADQFRVEAQALGRLDGFDNVLRVHGADILPDGRPYLITELCDGSLSQLIASRGPLSVEQATAIGYQMTRGLLAAHQQGILHGDVTPRNVLLRPSGVPVLADFGMAVLRDYGMTAATGRTLAHAAPEILRDDAVLTPASDVYGLGSTIYTALAGNPPFPWRGGENTQIRVLRVWSEPPPELPPAVPASLQSLVSAMLAKNPDDRPSLPEVADRLVNRPASPATMTTRAVTVGAFTSSLPYDEATRGRESTPDPGGGKTPRRRKLLIIGATAGVTLIASTIAVVLFIGGQPNPHANPVTTTTPPAAASASAPFSVAIELAQPNDLGDTVELSWTGPPNLTYNLSIAPKDQPMKTELAGRATTRRVAVEPGIQYCFRIEGTDGRQTYISNVQGIRGAICRFG